MANPRALPWQGTNKLPKDLLDKVQGLLRDCSRWTLPALGLLKGSLALVYICTRNWLSQYIILPSSTLSFTDLYFTLCWISESRRICYAPSQNRIGGWTISIGVVAGASHVDGQSYFQNSASNVSTHRLHLNLLILCLFLINYAIINLDLTI